MIPQQYANAYAGMFQRPQMPAWGANPPRAIGERIPGAPGPGAPIMQPQPVGPAPPVGPFPVQGPPRMQPIGTPVPYQPIGRMPMQPQDGSNFLAQLMQAQGGMNL